MHIQVNTFVCTKSSKVLTTREKLYQWLSLLIILKRFLKETGYKGGYIIGFFNLPEKTCQQKKGYFNEWDCYSIQTHVIKEMVPKVGCFAGFSHHCLTTICMSAHMHVYCYPLFESCTKTGLKIIILWRKDRVLLSKCK